MLHILRDLVQTNLLGNPLAPRSVLCARLVIEDVVDFLEGQTLEFREEDDRVDETDNAEGHEDHVGSPGDGSEHDWGDEGDGEVHEPAAGG